MAANPKEIVEAADVVANARDADVYLYVGDLDYPHDIKFGRMIRSHATRKNALLFLSTLGGDADSAYRIARSLQRKYDTGRLIVYVYFFCKSAGTLLTVAADEIVISDEGELGPLDVQLNKPDELAERISGLAPTQALTILRTESYKVFEDALNETRVRSGLQITTKMAAELASQMAIGLFRPIYEQLDPMRLAETERAVSVADAYGSRIIRRNTSKASLDRLITAYPSHTFVIDREEAKKLFQNVREPDAQESKLISLLQQGCQHDLNPLKEPLMGALNTKVAPSEVVTGEKDTHVAANTDKRDQSGKAGARENHDATSSEDGTATSSSARMSRSAVPGSQEPARTGRDAIPEPIVLPSQVSQ